jgi:hypothetical protein
MRPVLKNTDNVALRHRPHAVASTSSSRSSYLYEDARIMTNSVNYRLPGIGPNSQPEPSANTGTAGEEADSAESAEGACECGHPVARHDAVALRYCAVTIAGSLTRGCVCDAH